MANGGSPTNCDRCKAALDGAYSQRFTTKDKEWILKETVCLACDEQEHMERYRSTKRLHNKVMLPAALWVQDWNYLYGGPGGKPVEWMQSPDRTDQRIQISRRICAKEIYSNAYREIVAASEAIHDAVKAWERHVWFGPGGLQAYYKATEKRGHKAKIGDLEMLVWGCAGRVAVTFNRGDSSLTIMCDESSPDPRSGLHGIDATREEGLAILAEATTNGPAFLEALRPDEKVGMF